MSGVIITVLLIFRTIGRCISGKTRNKYQYSSHNSSEAINCRDAIIALSVVRGESKVCFVNLWGSLHFAVLTDNVWTSYTTTNGLWRNNCSSFACALSLSLSLSLSSAKLILDDTQNTHSMWYVCHWQTIQLQQLGECQCTHVWSCRQPCRIFYLKKI